MYIIDGILFRITVIVVGILSFRVACATLSDINRKTAKASTWNLNTTQTKGNNTFPTDVVNNNPKTLIVSLLHQNTKLKTLNAATIKRNNRNEPEHFFSHHKIKKKLVWYFSVIFDNHRGKKDSFILPVSHNGKYYVGVRQRYRSTSTDKMGKYYWSITYELLWVWKFYVFWNIVNKMSG